MRNVLVAADILTPSLLLVLVLYIQNWIVNDGRQRAIRAQASGSSIEISHAAPTAGQLPALSLSTLEGKDISIQDCIRDARIAVLVFWASYDAPWSPNLTNAESIFQKYKSRGCAVIGINEQEDRNTVTKFVQQKHISFQVLIDSTGSYLQALHLPGSIEKVLVVDSTGKILAHLSKTQDVTDRLSNIVETHLAGQ